MSAILNAAALLVAFGLGLMLGRRQVGALRQEVSRLRQLVDDLDDVVSRLRLSALVPPRPRDERGAL